MKSPSSATAPGSAAKPIVPASPASSPAGPPAAAMRDWPFRRCCCVAPSWTAISIWPSSKGLQPSPGRSLAGGQMVWPHPGGSFSAAIRPVAIADPTHFAASAIGAVLAKPRPPGKNRVGPRRRLSEVFHLSISGLAPPSHDRCCNPRSSVGRRRALREQGLLVVETIAEAARRLTGVRQNAPSRSILQPAA